jgi:hypothetical protein
MLDSGKAFRAMALSILICSIVCADDQRRGLGQPVAFVSGGNLYVMGEYRANRQAGWPGHLLLQKTPAAAVNKAAEYVLPVVASHSFEGGETRTCWSMAANTLWILVESDDVTKERNYNVIRLSVDRLGSYAMTDAGRARQYDSSAAGGMERTEALPMQVQQGLRAQAMQDYQGNDSALVRSGFDIHAIDDDLAALYLLVGNRMTVWCYSPKGYSAVDGRIIGPYRIDGLFLTAEKRWRQLATFDVPFKSAFRVVHKGRAVCFWTADGNVYECTGLDARMKGTVGNGPIVDIDTSDYTTRRMSPTKFLGENERRIVVKRMGSLKGVSMVMEDADGGRAFAMLGPQVCQLTTPTTCVILQQFRSQGHGLIEDAMDISLAAFMPPKPPAMEEPNLPRERPAPQPVKEEEPNKTY